MFCRVWLCEQLTELIIRCPSKLVEPSSLLALAINLVAHSARHAQLMCGRDGSGLHALIRRLHVIGTSDSVLMKLIRGLTEWGLPIINLFPVWSCSACFALLCSALHVTSDSCVSLWDVLCCVVVVVVVVVVACSVTCMIWWE